jgi:hypothetical protein
MTVQLIPVGSNSTRADPFSTQTTTLDGVPYLLAFSYAQREDCWYLLLLTNDGQRIYGSIKLVCLYSLFNQCVDARKPPGQLVVVSNSTDLSPPGLNDLLPSGRCSLVYFPAADVLTLSLSESALQGTVTVTNESTSVVFSVAQTLLAGTLLSFSEQPNVTYAVATSITNQTFATLTAPYTGPSGTGTGVEILTTAPLLSSPNATGQTGGAAPNVLNGEQCLSPITGSAGFPYLGACDSSVSTSVTIGGDPSYVYQTLVRIVGIVEQKTYSGGTTWNATGENASFFIEGGTPAADSNVVWQLTVSSPAYTYYLNSGTSGLHTTSAADYHVLLPIGGGATVTLSVATQGTENRNNTDGAGGSPLSIPGLTNPPQPYNGQFLNLYVLDVS